MCNCDKEFKEKILKKKPDMEKIVNQNVALGLDGKLIYYSQYELSKQTTTKGGKSRTVREKINVIWKHCPYCGEKMEDYDNE